jgi:NAD(P)-dependent dehydrogenase (short-subunit alcohol dehydrogenase family)
MTVNLDYTNKVASTVLVDVDPVAVNALAEELTVGGLDVLAVGGRCLRIRRLDVAFNNAGIMIPTADTDTAVFDRVMNVNILLRHPWAAPTGIAAAVLSLCSSGASYITGAAIPVGGGYTAN